MPTSTGNPWDTIVGEAGRESALWIAAARPAEEQEHEPVFSLLAEPRYALGVETIYEGYLLHYGKPRLFAPEDHDSALLLGDYLYAHGLVRTCVRKKSSVTGQCGQQLPRPLAAANWMTDGLRSGSTTIRAHSSGWPARTPETRRSIVPWRPIADACVRVTPMFALLQLLAVEDAATEGKKVITGMLIVGLIFLGVIVLGETTHWLRHRRR